MIINFSTDQFIERFVPLYKKTNTRLKWLRFLLSELKAMWQDFYNWRKDYYYRLNITGQTLLLEYHLNKVIPGANGSIRIKHYTDQGVHVALESEVIPSVSVGLIDTLGEESNYILAALEGEIQANFNVGFKVYVPTGINVNEVAGEVNTFKLGGISYEIVEA
jgi:hypothetical protein